MGRLPAAGLYVRHADGIRLRNLELIAERADARPAVVCEDVNDLTIASLEASAPAGGSPLVRLRDSAQVFLQGTCLPATVTTLAEVSGSHPQDIRCSGNALMPSQHELVSLAHGDGPS